MGSLPDFVPPMLAKLGVPFDSGEHLFEIKWDGIRALTFVEGGQHRMLTRSRNELTARYPELESLARLPEGTVLDGELVALRDGRPDFRAVMSREHARNPRRIQALARDAPVTGLPLLGRESSSCPR